MTRGLDVCAWRYLLLLAAGLMIPVYWMVRMTYRRQRYPMRIVSGKERDGSTSMQQLVCQQFICAHGSHSLQMFIAILAACFIPLAFLRYRPCL
jgi:hypothetical protein